MTTWAERAKVRFSQERQNPTAKTAERGVLAVLAVPPGGFCEKTHSDDPDRWCWPASDAMTGREIDTTDALVEAAMRACDFYNDSPAAREEMRADCLATPPHLKADLLAHFEQNYPKAKL